MDGDRGWVFCALLAMAFGMVALSTTGRAAVAAGIVAAVLGGLALVGLWGAWHD